MKSIVVGTAGHIDHGKSALVRALTGTDPDRLKEEKARGITIDLGFAHTTIDDLNVAFVDVPGHERFVKNMLAGAGGIDLVVLVVAADESVMPQTREHFEICRLLRVPAGVVALTKSDLADPETLELSALEVRELVSGSFLEAAPIVPVSSRSGDGLDAFRRALADAARAAARRATRAAVRLPIDRVFSMRGFGTVVTGTLVSGTIDLDAELVLLPGGRPVKVRGLQVHGARTTTAHAGQRVAVNAGGVEVGEVARGQTLVTPDAFVDTRVADAIVEVLADAKSLKHGTRVRFHQGTAEIIGRVAIAGPDGRAIEPGEKGFVRLRLETPTVLARGDRYILRSYSPALTIAGGTILDPVPSRSRLRTAAASTRFQALDPGDASDRDGADRRAVAALIADAGAAALPVAALVPRLGIDASGVAAVVDALVSRGETAKAGGTLVAPAVLERLRAAILTTLEAHHRRDPLSEDVPREDLRSQVFARGHGAVFDQALSDLTSAGRIVLRDRVALAGHQLTLTPEEAAARDAIERAYRIAGLTPPDPKEVSGSLPVKPDVAERVLKLLQRQKVLVRVGDLVFHDETLKRLKADVAGLKSEGAASMIDVATFKERFGVSRKFAIPLLEYLDRERLTRRVGDARVIL